MLKKYYLIVRKETSIPLPRRRISSGGSMLGYYDLFSAAACLFFLELQ
jgi:hypothetical protein